MLSIVIPTYWDRPAGNHPSENQQGAGNSDRIQTAGAESPEKAPSLTDSSAASGSTGSKDSTDSSAASAFFGSEGSSGSAKQEEQEEQDRNFDHPTPLDGNDTLTRCLESLKHQTVPIQVIVITATVTDSINEAVHKRVDAIIKPFKQHFPILQFSHKLLQVVQERIRVNGMHDGDISLKGYPNIRNCQLAVPAILGAEVIAAIDDDEVVEPNFAEEALRFVGKRIGGETIHGVAGRYYYEGDTFFVDEGELGTADDNPFTRKQVFQNQSYRQSEAQAGRLVDTSIVLGGNMVFSRELFMQVPFDPFITRGEDIDYLINSLMRGYRWMLDKELKIYHYPPPCRPSKKLEEDIVRFLYERKKIRLVNQLIHADAEVPGNAGSTSPQYHSEQVPLTGISTRQLSAVDIESLKPYPGEFFRDDLELHADDILSRRGFDAEERQRVLNSARDRILRLPEFFAFLQRWPDLMQGLAEDAHLAELLKRELGLL